MSQLNLSHTWMSKGTWCVSQGQTWCSSTKMTVSDLISPHSRHQIHSSDCWNDSKLVKPCICNLQATTWRLCPMHTSGFLALVDMRHFIMVCRSSVGSVIHHLEPWAPRRQCLCSLKISLLAASSDVWLTRAGTDDVCTRNCERNGWVQRIR